MRYEAGPFAGIRFFRLAEGGFLCSQADFSYRRELLAQSGEGFGLPGRIIALAE